MKLKKVGVFWLLVGSILVSCSVRRVEKPIAVPRGTAQLFIDDYLIASQQNVQRRLNQPVKDFNGEKPLLALEDEFGEFASTLEANGTIVYDPRLEKYVMFALGYSSQMRAQKPRRWESIRLYRFTSDDGMNWVKGDDGTPQWVFPRSPKDLYDPESGTSATNIDLFSCYYDQEDPEYPYKAWQWFSNWLDDREGLYYLYSKDGMIWQRGPMVVNGYGHKEDPVYRKIEQDGRVLVGPGDVTRFFYDEAENRFLASFKFFSPEKVEYGNRIRCRAYAFFSHPVSEPFDITTIERIALLPAVAERNNDKPYDEYYGSTGYRYESLWLGELKVWHSQGDYPWSAAGCAYLKLIVSRDGLNWKKVPFENADGYPEIYLPNGPEGGNNAQNDGGYVTVFSQGPLRIGDELIFYYGCSSYGKNHPNAVRMTGGGIFRARLRIDGFVSVEGGTLRTKQLSFEGKDLYLNAVGPVTVQVLDKEGQAVGLERIQGDSIRHKVLFDGKSLRDVVQGQIASLRFSISDGGKLYSFTIR